MKARLQQQTETIETKKAALVKLEAESTVKMDEFFQTVRQINRANKYF